MGNNPIPLRSRPTSQPVGDTQRTASREISILKRQYIAGDIGLKKFEEQVGNWLKWETLSDIERKVFETKVNLRAMHETIPPATTYRIDMYKRHVI